MLKAPFIRELFTPASMKRWNDQASPIEFSELDKQSHKTFIAYTLAKFEEQRVEIDWKFLIEAIIFEYLQRAILTDIKPPIFYKLREKKGRELTEFVINSLSIEDEKFKERMRSYLLDRDEEKLERRILRASHFLASKWEFDIIYNFNSELYQVREIKLSLENQIEEFYDLIGVQRVMLKRQTFEFVNAIGQLRFQLRWSQTPRIPKTSVLGHMFNVALFAYLLSDKLNFSKKRIYNNFFGGLFHDLPEVLTRDIISPIKYSVKGLDKLIKEYEIELIEEKILPLLPKHMHSEIRYFVFDEFDNKIIRENKIEKINSIKKMSQFNSDEFSAIDGKLLKICDHLSAFTEAKISIENGIKSQDLKDAIKSLEKKYAKSKKYGVDVSEIFNSFRES